MRTIHNLSENFSDGLLFPKGTSAERGNPEAGYFRYNTETKGIEVYDGTSWSSMDNTPSYVTDGLVLNLDAGNLNSYAGSGTTWSDLSQDGTDLVINGTTYNSDGYFVLNGTSDRMYRSYTASLNPSDITVLCWAYLDNWNQTFTGGLGSLINTERGGNGYAMGCQSFSGNLAWEIWTNSGWVTSNYALSNISSGWHCLIGTSDGSNIKLYLDSVEVDSLTAGSIVYTRNDSQFNIGAYQSGNGSINSYFPGNIAITQVYDKALSSDEVTQNFNATKTRFGL